MGEWIERIGWPQFFELTGIEFTKYHIDDFKHAGLTYHAVDAHPAFVARRASHGAVTRRSRWPTRCTRWSTEYQGKKNLKAGDLTKAMIEKFGEADCNKDDCARHAIRQLMDSGRCVYTLLRRQLHHAAPEGRLSRSRA